MYSWLNSKLRSDQSSIDIWDQIFFFFFLMEVVLCIVGCLVESLASDTRCHWNTLSLQKKKRKKNVCRYGLYLEVPGQGTLPVVDPHKLFLDQEDALNYLPTSPITLFSYSYIIVFHNSRQMLPTETRCRASREFSGWRVMWVGLPQICVDDWTCRGIFWTRIPFCCPYLLLRLLVIAWTRQK